MEYELNVWRNRSEDPADNPDAKGICTSVDRKDMAVIRGIRRRGESAEDFTVKVKLHGDAVPGNAEKKSEVLSAAVTMAVKDMLDENSSLYKDVYVPFSMGRPGPDYYSHKTFMDKLIIGIVKPDSGDLRLDAYVSIEGKRHYFSFCTTDAALHYAFTDDDRRMLLSAPSPGVGLLETGAPIMLNDVLGYYYRFLAEWCVKPDDPVIRDLRRWQIGPH